jgi:hypothetical protein
MSESILSRVLRKAGLKSTEAYHSRLESLGSPLPGYRKDGQWPRMFAKRYLAVAASMSATLVVFFLVSESEIGKCVINSVLISEP